MNRQLINIFFLFIIMGHVAYAQGKYNYILINDNDTQENIIRKAANVVPSERQLRWQKLELIAFVHFNLNSFTGKEWGEGNENPKLFNPQKFDEEQWVKANKDAGFKQLINRVKYSKL